VSGFGPGFGSAKRSEAVLDRRSLLRVHREHPLDESDEILVSVAM
jgi:hypothetical protein